MKPNRTRFLIALSASLSLVLLAVHAPVRGQTRAQVQSARFAIHGPDGQRQWAMATWPSERPKTEGWPVVIAFHGMHEAKLGKERGYRAWVDYGLPAAFEALLAPPLSKAAFGGLVRDAELASLNAELALTPFRGLFVVGLYTPDLLAQVDHPEQIDAFASWVAKKLVPKVQSTFPVAALGARRVGIDGVSLGGMVALEVGLRFPEVFASVGTMQPAIRGREAELAERAQKATQTAPQQLRLLSSDDDPLLPITRKFSDELRKRRVAHTLIVSPGGHDYAFNRGPGAIELLHFHDRALRSNPKP